MSWIGKYTKLGSPMGCVPWQGSDRHLGSPGEDLGTPLRIPMGLVLRGSGYLGYVDSNQGYNP